MFNILNILICQCYIKKNSTQKNIYIHFILFEDFFYTCIPRKQEISLSLEEESASYKTYLS